MNERKPSRHSSRLSSGRVYAIFTLDLIFWRRASLSRDRYMSHSRTRAARIKTSKRKPTRIPHPILCLRAAHPASSSSLLLRRPPLPLSVPHHPLCHHTWYTPLLPRPPPPPTPTSPRQGAQQREQKYEESKGLAHNRFSLSLVIALSSTTTSASATEAEHRASTDFTYLIHIDR